MSMLMRRAFMRPPSPVYATWNPADKDANVTLSNGNLTCVTGVSNKGVRSTLGKSSGKWYCELTRTGTGGVYAGISTASVDLTSPTPVGTLSYLTSGGIYNEGSFVGAYDSIDNGDVWSMALDADAKTVKFYRNGIQQGSTATYTFSNPVYLRAVLNSTADTLLANFGATAFAYPPPGGYNAGLYV